MTTPATIPTEEQRREAWLQERRTVLTGTDMAAILGRGAFGTTGMTVWLDKKGLSEPKAENDAMRFGKRWEPFLLQDFSDRTGIEILRADPYQLFKSTQVPIGATLDARVQLDLAPVEAKTTSSPSEEWGEPGTDKIPTHYLLQVAAQMHVTDKPYAHVAAFFRARCETRFYLVQRDLDLEAVMLERAQAWWQRHIIQDIEPIDGSDAASEYLERRFKRNVTPLLQADDTAAGIMAELAMIRAREERLAEGRAEAENKLKAIIGEAEGIQSAAGKITWKNNKDSEKVDWEGLGRVYLATMEPYARANELSNYTTIKPGARVFRFTPAKEKA